MTPFHCNNRARCLYPPMSRRSASVFTIEFPGSPDFSDMATPLKILRRTDLRCISIDPIPWEIVLPDRTSVLGQKCTTGFPAVSNPTGISKFKTTQEFQEPLPTSCKIVVHQRDPQTLLRSRIETSNSQGCPKDKSLSKIPGHNP